MNQVQRPLGQVLLDAGVRVYEWQPSTLHAKTFVVDGAWVTIGSMNFDNRSMALNDEATLMVAVTQTGVIVGTRDLAGLASAAPPEV